MSVAEFNRGVIEATSDLAICYKPQIAHYSAAAIEDDLLSTIDFLRSQNLPVILDAKRNDIGSTADRYASEVFERYGADATTVNPYLGYDGIAPFLEYEDKGVFVLAKTSNPTASWQNWQCDAEPLYLKLARSIHDASGASESLGFVVGATDPDALATMRRAFPDTWFLAPGVGAQGATPDEVLQNAGKRVVFNASRSVLYGDGSGNMDYFTGVRERAQALACILVRHN